MISRFRDKYKYIYKLNLEVLRVLNKFEKCPIEGATDFEKYLKVNIDGTKPYFGVSYLEEQSSCLEYIRNMMW